MFLLKLASTVEICAKAVNEIIKSRSDNVKIRISFIFKI